ncbi:MAG: hypothetical protein OXU43_05945 [Gammaproteobacteria bacterium]|nr:hypothetical protein [Gammaproteobacteria bacterium]
MSLLPPRKRSMDITGLATAGVVAGLTLGLALQGGIWCVASALSFAVFGNVISGLQSGELLSIMLPGEPSGRYYYNKAERPTQFWVGMALECALAIFVLVLFLRGGLPPEAAE